MPHLHTTLDQPFRFFQGLITQTSAPLTTRRVRLRRSRIGAVLGVAFGATGIGVAHCCRADDGAPAITTRLLPGAADAGERLAALVAVNGYQHLPVVATLPADACQLFSITRPVVARHELAQAAAWQVQDELAQPLDETLLDVCDDCSAGDPARVWVVAAALRAVEHHTRLLEKAGLDVDALDAPTLTLRNLALQLHAERPPLWLLLAGEPQLLCVIAGGRPWLQRRMQPITGSDTARAQRLAEELERTRSYLLHRHGFPACDGRLLIVGEATLAETLVDAMAGKPGFDSCQRLADAHVAALSDQPRSATACVLQMLACAAALRGHRSWLATA